MNNKLEEARAEAKRLWTAYDKIPATSSYKRSAFDAAKQAREKVYELKQKETV